MLISPAYAEGAANTAAAAPSLGASLLPFLLVMGIFYFIMIRPQQKRHKEHQATLKSISRGDKVVTSGGIIGKVTKAEDDVLHLEIAENTVVQVIPSTIANVLESKAKKAEEAKKKSEDQASNVAKKTAKKKVANDN